MSALVTILIPNYKTPDLTKLCLRLIRKYTSPKLAEVIVIDNDSADASLEYLRQIKWIRLIERTVVPYEHPVTAHARALDLGLQAVNTPYVLSIHTDTLVKHPQWLEFLITSMTSSPHIAGVGSWKLETKHWIRRMLKNVEQVVQTGYSYLIRNPHPHVYQSQPYLRSHCALFRMDLIQKLKLNFGMGGQVACKGMHEALVTAGYEMLFLTAGQLLPYLDHINHATSVLNPKENARSKTVYRGLRRIQQKLQTMNAYDILGDHSLDV